MAFIADHHLARPTSHDASRAGELVAARAGCSLAAIKASVAEHAGTLPAELADDLRHCLWEDVASEYDARFLGDRLAGLGFEFSAGFRAAVETWERDELGHHFCSRTAWIAAFGRERALDLRLAARRPDFAPLAAFFEDEFTILCLLAYDELATVRAYRANLPLYEPLGRPFMALMHRIMADEARHYASFLSLARSEHPERAVDAGRVISSLRAVGVPYAATFVLDHDDPIFTSDLLDETARILRVHLAR